MTAKLVIDEITLASGVAAGVGDWQSSVGSPDFTNFMTTAIDLAGSTPDFTGSSIGGAVDAAGDTISSVAEGCVEATNGSWRPMIKPVWVEKYRPKTVADVIVTNERDRTKFDSFVAAGEFPNIMLQGGPGTGKSSMSQALIKSIGIERVDVLRINCSDEKIDAMRDKVKNFAMTMSIGRFKVVRLEEIDGIGHDAQKLLRSLIEDTSGSCRYIATCNNANLIMPPLRSRFHEYQFAAPLRENVLVRAAEILEAEDIEFSIEDLEKTVAAGYPDFRKIIQLLESNSIGGRLNIDGGGAAHDWKLELLPLIEAGDIKACRALVCSTASANELIEVYRFLYDNIHRCKKLKKQDEAIVLIAQYQYQHGFVNDPELQIAALFIEISQLL